MKNADPQRPVLGIVGGVGAGKSTVAAELAGLGCRVVDADAVGHELLGEPEIQDQLRRRWGCRIFSPAGEVDRAALSEIVFSDSQQLEALNGIIHPSLGRRLAERIEQARREQSVPAVVLDAAVILEAGWDKLCTHLVFVSAPDEARQARTAENRKWDAAHWQAREKSQISLDLKAQKCDYRIDNSSTVPHLREQVRQLFFQMVHTTELP